MNRLPSIFQNSRASRCKLDQTLTLLGLKIHAFLLFVCVKVSDYQYVRDSKGGFSYTRRKSLRRHAHPIVQYLSPDIDGISAVTQAPSSIKIS